MTTNQTIDGVPRELLELAAKQLVFYGRELVASELRALLAKPAVQPPGEPVACATIRVERIDGRLIATVARFDIVIMWRDY